MVIANNGDEFAWVKTENVKAFRSGAGQGTRGPSQAKTFGEKEWTHTIPSSKRPRSTDREEEPTVVVEIFLRV